MHPAMTSARVVAMFPGQGSQCVGMGKQISLLSRSAAAVFEEVDAALCFPLSRTMFQGPMEELSRTENAQPAILAVSVAYARLLEERQLLSANSAKLAAGHSVGEYSALVFARSLALADAAMLLRARGQLMQSASDSLAVPVAMSALMPSSAADVEAVCERIRRETSTLVQVANINSREQIVISGTEVGVRAAEEACKASRVARKCIRLPVSAPFHCSAMLPAAVGLRPLLSACTFATPVCPVLSNVTARPYESVTDIPDLLVDQVVSPVDWLGCMTYAGDKDTEFVEIGQGRTLTNLAGRIHPKSRAVHAEDLLKLA